MGPWHMLLAIMSTELSQPSQGAGQALLLELIVADAVVTPANRVVAMAVVDDRPALMPRDIAPGIVALAQLWACHMHVQMLANYFFLYVFLILPLLPPQHVFHTPVQWPHASSVPSVPRCARGRLMYTLVCCMR